jgi:hypothetical protein
MTTLYLTEDDTKPTVCNLAMDLTGSALSLKVGYPVPLVKDAVITDAPNGAFQFEWAAGDLQPGRFAASIEITDSSGYVETTEPFEINVDRRIQ